MPNLPDGGAAATFQWQAVAGATGYIVQMEHWDGASAWESRPGSGQLSATSWSFSLEYGKSRWRVLAVNNAGTRGPATDWRVVTNVVT